MEKKTSIRGKMMKIFAVLIVIMICSQASKALAPDLGN